MIEATRSTRIQRLLATDASNANLSPEIIGVLHPWAVEAFDQTDLMFDRVIDVLRDWPLEREILDQVKRVGEDAGLSDDDFAAKLIAGQLADVPGALAGVAHLRALRAQKQLVLACQRYWAWGASDLLRLRVTSAMAYLRLQAECVGFIELFKDEHDLAERWSRPSTQAEGRKFFNDTQPKLKAALRTRNLGTVYDIASNTSLHVRLAGLVRSLVGEGGTLALPDQEFAPEDPYSFHLAVAYFHRNQARFLHSLGQLLVRVDDGEWREAMARFGGKADEMWRALENRYRDEIAREGEPD